MVLRPFPVRPAVTLGILLTVVALLVFGTWFIRPKWSEETVRTVVVTTMQREAPQSFYVTGVMELVATLSSSSTKVLWPNLLNLNLGTTESTLRCPAKVSYGFDVGLLTEDKIQVSEDGTVSVELPPLSVYAVEPDLERLEIQTEVGWARLYKHSGIEQERTVLRALQGALRGQVENHIATSAQPKLNTARAIETLLRAPLEAAGLEDPKFHIEVRPGLQYRPESD